ncbi:MAG: polysaccharide biosynthesis protein [Luteitalea sp.]
MPLPRLLLVGAGFTGRVVASEYVRNGRLPELIGFLDDDPVLRGASVEGVPVLGMAGDLEALVPANAITDVVVTIPSLSGPRLRTIVDHCRAAGVPVRTMPAILELLGEPLSSRLARPVQVADLLRRTQVDCKQPPEPYLRGATVLITGAGASIGSELARQVARADPGRLLLVGHGENSIHHIGSQLHLTRPDLDAHPVIADIRDRAAMSRLFERERPDVVFHAAAHKHVPLMEAHADEAVLNNVLGTRHVVEAAARVGVARLIFISTDKAVRPVSIMGATKRVGEWIVRDAGLRTGCAYATVRFGNVLGSRGSVVPLLERQVARGGPVTITDPRMTRFFMTIPEAVWLVLRAGGFASAGELFVLDMGAPVRILDLAHDLIRLTGESPDRVSVVFTGLRPGEKLSEQLWDPDSVVSRVDADVLSVREPGDGLADQPLRQFTDRLIAAAELGLTRDIRDFLQAAVMAPADVA